MLPLPTFIIKADERQSKNCNVLENFLSSFDCVVLRRPHIQLTHMNETHPRWHQKENLQKFSRPQDTLLMFIYSIIIFHRTSDCECARRVRRENIFFLFSFRISLWCHAMLCAAYFPLSQNSPRRQLRALPRKKNKNVYTARQQPTNQPLGLITKQTPCNVRRMRT